MIIYYDNYLNHVFVVDNYYDSYLNYVSIADNYYDNYLNQVSIANNYYDCYFKSCFHYKIIMLVISSHVFIADKLPPIIIDGPPHQMIFKLGESTFKLNCVALRARR